MSVLVDSDVLIEVARGNDATLVAQWLALSESRTAILYSPVSVAEMWATARPVEHEALDSLFAALTGVDIDSEIARQAGEYLQRFHKSHGVELGEALIAATAICNKADLWTRNRKRYPMPELTFTAS